MVISPLVLFLSLLIFLLATSGLIAICYVLGSYLIYAYDRCLSTCGQLDPPHDHLPPLPKGWDRFRGILLEIGVTFLVIWLFPLGKIGKRSRYKASKGKGTTPILLVHGLSHNRSGWIRFQRHLRRAGFGPIYSFNLPKAAGSLGQLAHLIGHEADHIQQETGAQELILIGHSMGGLLCAYYAEKLAPAGKVSHVVTIGSPLQGTRSAYLNASPVAGQMRLGSQFLQDLRYTMAVSRKVRHHHIGSQFDNIIFPFQSALMGKTPDFEYLLGDLGHLTLLFSTRVVNQVIAWLKAVTPVDEPKELAALPVPRKSSIRRI